MEEEIHVDENEMAEFIFDRLLTMGMAVQRDEIKTILALEMAYYEHIGLVEEE